MYKLPTLPYDYDALEPYIDERTMRIHHDMHHAGYVKKLNGAIKDLKDDPPKDERLLLKRLKDIPEAKRRAVRNNAGGHVNHSLFWRIMSPNGQKPSKGRLNETIESTFGSLETFKEKFTGAALGRFGSGWAWLVVNKKGLGIESTPNQDSPVMEGKVPVLGIDVWEHAYYLKYQNRRADYVKAWWNVVDWEKVEEIFLKKST